MAALKSFRGYQIEGKLGAGGMSTLYLGIQTALNRRVAIKVLHPGLADDESFIARFEREAKTASAIGHKNIVSVFDFGVEDDVYYIVMELVDGTDLKEALRRAGRFPPGVVLAILTEVCDGLEAAHEQGVIHRDMKPGNVMLSRKGDVKVADFGLARPADTPSTASALTLPGAVLGTTYYMSPEQAGGQSLDARTDIYSVGAMAYELLSSEKPFRGSTHAAIRDLIVSGEAPPLGERVPLNDDVVTLVGRMMAKDRSQRFQTMREVRRAAEDCMESLDRSGYLMKHKSAHLRKFAEAPEAFREELEHDRKAVAQVGGITPSDPPQPVALNGEMSGSVRDVTPVEPTVSGRVSGGREAGGTAVYPREAPPLEPKRDEENRRHPSARRRLFIIGGAAAALALALGGLVFEWFKQPGAIAVITEPAGAAVFLRGAADASFRSSGLVTNCRIGKLARGPWEIRVDAPGYRPEVRRVDVERGREERLQVTLAPIVPAPAPARLRVTCAPAGVSVVLRRRGSPSSEGVRLAAPAEFTGVAPGEWEVLAEEPGYVRQTRQVTLGAGGYDSLAFTLTKGVESGARFRISVNPPSVSHLEVDGRSYDTSTGWCDALLTSSGKHRFASPQFPGMILTFTSDPRDDRRRLRVDFERQEVVVR